MACEVALCAVHTTAHSAVASRMMCAILSDEQDASEIDWLQVDGCPRSGNWRATRSIVS